MSTCVVYLCSGRRCCSVVSIFLSAHKSTFLSPFSFSPFTSNAPVTPTHSIAISIASTTRPNSSQNLFYLHSYYYKVCTQLPHTVYTHSSCIDILKPNHCTASHTREQPHTFASTTSVHTRSHTPCIPFHTNSSSPFISHRGSTLLLSTHSPPVLIGVEEDADLVFCVM